LNCVQLYKLDVVRHNMNPPLPLIAITNDTVDLITEDYPLDKATALGLLKSSADEAFYFDKQGTVWKSIIFSDTYKLTAINKLLAKTFYNPIIKVKRDCMHQHSYELEELKKQLCVIIDKDDDILTQFVEAEMLKGKVNACTDFKCIVDTLIRYIFKQTKNKLIKRSLLKSELRRTTACLPLLV
jgi:hypothetical protein